MLPSSLSIWGPQVGKFLFRGLMLREYKPNLSGSPSLQAGKLRLLGFKVHWLNEIDKESVWKLRFLGVSPFLVL